MNFTFHECSKDGIIAELQDEKNELEIRLRDAKQQNYRLQVQLLENLSGTKLNINLFEEITPVSTEEGVSIEMWFNNFMGCKTIRNFFQ